MAVFASRQIVMPATTIAVTITGSGDAYECYVTIDGTKQYEAGMHEVNAGDTITFGVYGNHFDTGYVKIDDTTVLEVTDETTQTYYWTVPSGISTIEISMTLKSSYNSDTYGQITVTTA